MSCACGRPVTVKRTGQCHACRERDRRRNPVGPIPAINRFMAKVAQASDGDCWLWQGWLTSTGYGGFSLDGRAVAAHRWSYEHFRVEIPDGLVIDHLCRTPACVNPWHMEPVTIAVNSLRGEAPAVQRWRDDRCIRGHDLSNAYVRRDTGARICRACQRERWAEQAKDPEFRRRHAERERNRQQRLREAAK